MLFSFSTCLSIQLCRGVEWHQQSHRTCCAPGSLGDTLPAPRRLCRALSASLCSHPRGGGSLHICKMLINTREAFSSDSVCCPPEGDAHLSKGNALSGKTPGSGKAIRSCQHGFTEGKSCLTNPIAFYDETNTWMDEGRAVCFVYLDFSKACDCLPSHLLDKVRKCGL